MPARDTLQDERNFQHAKESLRNLIASLDLVAIERDGLEADLAELQGTYDKLENDLVRIAAFGMVGRGKSSLLNALAGTPAFETGPTHGVTRQQQAVDWDISRQPLPATSAGQSRAIVRVTVPSIDGARIQLIDTPGIDEVGGEEREALALEIARKADLILFVVSGDITRVEFEALSTLREAGKPMILVFNKVDQYPDADRDAIYATIRDERLKELLSPDEIVMASAAPRVPVPVRRADGSMTATLKEGMPRVESLRLKIMDILHREGRSLMALNSLLFADRLNEQLVRRKFDIRSEYADELVWKAARVKAAVVALNPITVFDTIGGAVVDVMLVVQLSKLYGLPMTRKGAVELLQKIALSMGSIGASEMLAMLGLGSLKSFLGSAAPVTGGLSLGAYASVALTQAAVAGGSCYAIGKATKHYLANGASWGKLGPKAAISQILDSMDEASIVARIKDELRSTIQPQTDSKTSDAPASG
ncbi:MAG: GTP-binding protein [Cyanobacteria bacterium P01_D01_bin.123]